MRHVPGPRSRRWFALSATLPRQLFLVGLVIALGTAGTAYALLSRWAAGAREESMRRALDQSSDLVAQFLAGRQRSLTGGAKVFVQGPYFRAIVAEHRRDDILDQTFEAVSQLDADWVFIVDERGVLLAKSDEPGASGADLSGVALVAGALQGRVTGGFGVSRDSLLFQAAAIPIVVPGGAPIGVLVATKIVDSLLARDVKAVTDADVVFFTRPGNAAPRIAATTVRGARDAHAALARIVAPVIRAGGAVHVDVKGDDFAAQGASLASAGGEPLGGYAVLRPWNAGATPPDAVRDAILVALLLGGVLAAGAAALVRRAHVRQLAALASGVRHIVDPVRVPLAAPTSRTSNVSRSRPVTASAELDALAQSVQATVAELRERAVLALRFAAVARTVAPATTERSARTTSAILSLAGRSSADRSATVRASVLPRSITAPSTFAVDTLLASRYLLEDVLRSDQLGETLLAHDRASGHDVALTFLRLDRVFADASTIGELRTTTAGPRALAHRNVEHVHDVGIANGAAFVTAELEHARPITELLREGGPLDRELLHALAAQLCRGFAAAHDAGVVHGAFTSSHCLVTHDGRALATGFVAASAARQLRRVATGGGVTERPEIAGATVGLPEYMAPEQLLGAEPDARSDVYAIGVVLFEAATGATPFQTSSPLAFLGEKLLAASPPFTDGALSAPDAPRAHGRGSLLDVISRLLETDADRRPSSARAALDLVLAAG